MLQTITNSPEGWFMLVAGLVVGFTLFFNKILHKPWWVRYPIAGLSLSCILHGSTYLLDYRTDIRQVAVIAVALHIIAICLSLRGLRLMEKLANRAVSNAEGERIRGILKEAGLPMPVPGSLKIRDGRLEFAMAENERTGTKAVQALLRAGFRAPIDEDMGTDENKATDTEGGGCDVWIAIEDLREPLFR